MAEVENFPFCIFYSFICKEILFIMQIDKKSRFFFKSRGKINLVFNIQISFKRLKKKAKRIPFKINKGKDWL